MREGWGVAEGAGNPPRAAERPAGGGSHRLWRRGERLRKRRPVGALRGLMACLIGRHMWANHMVNHGVDHDVQVAYSMG